MTTIKEYLYAGSKDPIIDFVKLDKSGLMESQIAIYQLGQERDKNYYILSANKDVSEYIEKRVDGISYTDQFDGVRITVKKGSHKFIFGNDDLRVFIIYKYNFKFNKQNFDLDAQVQLLGGAQAEFTNQVMPLIENKAGLGLSTIVNAQWDKFLETQKTT